MPNETFEELLAMAAQFHGHLCTGQVIGVRMASLGIRELGLNDPRGADRKKLVVLVEIDRCATDAIMTVTGCRIGRRSMKVVDRGKMAATFVDIETNRAVRIVSLTSAREEAAARYPHLDANAAQMTAYRELPDELLFAVAEVAVTLLPEDLPGPPLGKALCDGCGETVLDRREVREEGRTLCRDCASGASYYRLLGEYRKPLSVEMPV